MVSLANIDLNLLKVLDVLLEEKNVTRAAQRLGRSQPATSNALSRLRHMIGDPLLVRSKNGMMLTNRAESLRQPLRDIIASIENTFVEIDNFDPASASGLFTIGGPDLMTLAIVPRLFERLHKSAPGMDLHIVNEGRQKVMESLHQGIIDLAIDPWPEESPWIKRQYLIDGEYYCLFRADHPIADQGDKLGMTDFLNYSHVLVDPSGVRFGLFDEMLAGRGLERRVALSVANVTMVPLLLLRSDLIAVFPRLICSVLTEDINGLAASPVPLPLKRIQAHMNWLVRNDLDPKHRWLRKEISQICADMAHRA